MSGAQQVTQQLFQICERSLEDLGFELVDLEVVAALKGMTIRLFVDRQAEATRISLDDCVKISRYLGDVLDAEDPIARAYTLEVSSPGLDRRLRKPRHFSSVVGQTIKVATLDSVGGRKRFRGELLSADEASISLRVDKETYDIRIENIEKANLIYRFG